ncbi:MAG TPA: hypothetical protein VMF60_05605, partial [Acidimicrobiales bacterium]|nr:hypothetical protein [Acidimicrobiales bacterium]
MARNRPASSAKTTSTAKGARTDKAAKADKGATSRGAKGASREKAESKKRRVRTAVFRAMMRVGFLRHFYIRRLLRFIEKSRAKGRSLPPELVRLDDMLRRLPPPKRAEALEAALLAGPEESQSRELRRAASRQDRIRSDGRGYRPGA